TVLFATHYLEEADEVADRIVLMARGRVVADGTPSTVKASVAGRLVTFRSASLTGGELRSLPGVGTVERTGRQVKLHTSRSDDLLRQLLDTPDAHEIEATTPGLTAAFRALPSDADKAHAACLR